jgi:hypothetical protein
MTLPGFSAADSLYKSIMTYQLNSSDGKVSVRSVIPSLSDNWPEVRCRVNCFSRYRNNPALLSECLSDC